MKTVFSFILSFAILFTSMGFTFSSHFCGGNKVKTEFALGHSDVSCAKKKAENTCASGKQMKSDCCKDEYQKIQIEDDYTIQLTTTDLSPSFVIAFVDVYFDFTIEKTTKKLYTSYVPPPLIRDISVLIQSFLI